MKKRKYMIAAALMLAVCLTAHAEGTLVSFVDAAEKLAYHTDNVTITGQAEFVLDGWVFKFAEIAYAQDGENSLWREKLLTPREGKDDLESGFTVIQNGSDIYVMETLHPGICREGTDDAQNSLLRRSPVSDLLFAMARGAAEQKELFFGSGAEVTELSDGGLELTLTVGESGGSALLDQLANLCMRFAGKRLLGIDSDTVAGEYYAVTPVEQILYETKEFSLRKSDVTVRMDGSGRLTKVSGIVSAALTGYGDGMTGSGWTRHDLEIRFEIDLSLYGGSVVLPFDPAMYRVALPGSGEE